MTSKFKNSYLPEFAALMLGRSKPSMVTVNITNQCDQQCIYCEIGKNIPSQVNNNLTAHDLFWIIDEIAENRIPKISLCGGEPLLFEGIIDVISYAGKKNIRCSITTNGMTAFKLDKSQLQILKETGTEINISVDSFDECIETQTRGTSAALPNALKSIKVLSEYEIPVTLLSTISKYNYHDLYNFLVKAWELGIKQVLFQPIIYFSNFPDRPVIENKPQLNVSVDKLDVLMGELKKILDFEKTHNINTNTYRIIPWIASYLKTAERQNGNWFFDDLLNKFYCRELYAIIDITYDGGIQPCGLACAKINIHKNRHLGLINLWMQATAAIKRDLENEKYRVYCNGCCHHFSRNMLASIFKYPVKNRKALISMTPLLLSRVQSRIFRKSKNNIE